MKGVSKMLPGRGVKRASQAQKKRSSFDPRSFHLAGVMPPWVMKSLNCLDMWLDPSDCVEGPRSREVCKLRMPGQ